MANNIRKPFFEQEGDSYSKRTFMGIGTLSYDAERDSYRLNVQSGDAPRRALVQSPNTIKKFDLPVDTAFFFTISANTNNPWSEGYGVNWTLLQDGPLVKASELMGIKRDPENKVVIHQGFGLNEAEVTRYNKALEAYDKAVAGQPVPSTDIPAEAGVPAEDDETF